MPPEIAIAGRSVGIGHPTYFIADIAANHDGDLERAKELIHLVAEAGGNAAKFQHFEADTIVSDRGFRVIGRRQSHQATWSKSVYEVYADASLDRSWTPVLQQTCIEAGIDFFTSPYSPELVDAVEPYVVAYKIGSGDITWPEIIDRIASKGMPVLLSAGASTLEEVEAALQRIRAHTDEIALLQCNTNYTGAATNIRFVNLNVLRTFAVRFPDIVLGLSDHTQGDVAVLGAVALGARVIEKHFTDDQTRQGPDHAFAMTPATWKKMVGRTRELEAALGDGVKRVEENEAETVILQRRAVRAAHDIEPGDPITAENVEVLRPCPEGSIGPDQLKHVIGRVVTRRIARGDALAWSDLA